MIQNAPKTPLTETAPESAFEPILEALTGLRFGSVEITVHDGRIVQIERREKFRPQASN